MSKRSGCSLTEQVASTLEKEIFEGVLAPNSTLPSTRSLAERFHVSQRVVLGALDLLEKKDILLRLERKKVIVKARDAVSGAKEILFFAFGEELSGHTIYLAIQEMILMSGKERKYDFFSRLVSSSDLHSSRLEREIARLGNLGFIDCAIFYGFFTEEEIKLCQTLPYPIIFLGELPDSGHLPNGTRLLSPNTRELLLTAAKYALEKKAEFFALAYWEKPGKTAYGKNFMGNLKEFLQEHHLPYEFIPIPGQDLEEARNNFEKQASAIAENLPAGTLLAVQNLHSTLFTSGKLLPADQYPWIKLLSMDTPTSEPAIPGIQRSFRGLQEAILEEIRNSNDPVFQGSSQKIIDLHYQVIEK